MHHIGPPQDLLLVDAMTYLEHREHVMAEQAAQGMLGGAHRPNTNS